MFGGSSKTSSSKTKRNAEIDSLVGGNTKVCGDVHFTGGLHIDGTIDGNVIAESESSILTTSEKGNINGNVTVHNIVLNGHVVGDVHALHHIELAPNARVTGNVYYNIIEMAMGAEVNGNLIHVKNGEKTDHNVTQSAKTALDAEPLPVDRVVQGGQ
jgi:cytoskeletal protein CcmA (bactofilin family)